ncbi:hypothetical protein ACIQ9P_03565 [Kitasatospora sp. NPDC094019]|uniref:hypothetical protein n=1 Tax=Kitasatospora sp. NPDC094019 TaxID=3364091 RepID=UPI00380C2315
MYFKFPGEDATANEIANQLEQLVRTTPPRTVHLTNLVEATAHWVLHDPRLTDAHRAFATTRAAYWPYNDTTETWTDLHEAAQLLAAQLRRHGDYHLVPCEEDAGGGACPGVLDASGICCYDGRHEQPDWV